MPEPFADRPPPTVRDEALGAAVPAPSRPSRGRAVAIVLSILASLLLVGGVAFYLFVWRYEPVAQRHIPGNAALVMRFDFAEIALFGPVRKHFWPLFAEQRGDVVKGKTRAERMKEATGVDFTTDLRELYLASADGSTWVLLLGGKIKKDRFVHGLAALAKEESWPGFHEEGELLLGPGGAAIGQADDGTLIFGNGADVVRAALPASKDYERLALPHKGSAVFSITHEAWEGAAGQAVVAHASVLRKIERATGQLNLGKEPTLAMEIEPAQGTTAPALTGEIEQLLAELRIVTLILPDQAGEKGALQAAKVAAKGDRVTVSAPWSYDALDQACARWAERFAPVRSAAH
ncbi:MAG: hypothetical protein U0359_27510 [Byssovorax sp.]